MEEFYENNEIRDFEVKIFAAGDCQSFLPMSFVKTKEKLCVMYHTEGFKPLNLDQLENPYEVLSAIEKLVVSIKAAQNHLILHSRYYLNPNLIYADQKKANIKIKFIPKSKLSIVTFSQEIIMCLREMHFGDIRCCEYINMVIDKMENENLSIESLINYLGELKREAYLCGWE